MTDTKQRWTDWFLDFCSIQTYLYRHFWRVFRAHKWIIRLYLWAAEAFLSTPLALGSTCFLLLVSSFIPFSSLFLQDLVSIALRFCSCSCRCSSLSSLPRIVFPAVHFPDHSIPTGKPGVGYSPLTEIKQEWEI